MARKLARTDASETGASNKQEKHSGSRILLNRREYMVAGAMATSAVLGTDVVSASTSSDGTETLATDFGEYVNPDTAELIDSFENDLSPYSGDVAEATIVAESGLPFAARDGDNVLEIASSWSELWSVPGDGLPNYFQKGQEATFYLRHDDVENGPGYFMFRADGNAFNWFRAAVRPAANGGEIIIRDEYNAENLANAFVDIHEGEWYRGVVQLDDGETFGGADNDINFTLYDSAETEVASISANSSVAADEAGVGFAGTNLQTAVYFDFTHLTEP